MTPPAIQCQACKSANVRRSHRAGLLEKAYGLVGRYPYRCHGCQTRFFLARKSNTTAFRSERRQERVKSDKKRRARMIVLFAVSLVLFLFFAWKFILPPPAQQTGIKFEPQMRSDALRWKAS